MDDGATVVEACEVGFSWLNVLFLVGFCWVGYYFGHRHVKREWDEEKRLRRLSEHRKDMRGGPY